MAWGPLVWLENHHQVVVVGLGLLMQMGAQPCSWVWGKVGPTRKMLKMKETWDCVDEVGYFNT